jgi:hypothetical protein
MIRRLSFTAMIALTFWLAIVAASIKAQNAATGYYLPRRGSGADREWRTSMRGDEPRDRLYKLVAPAGLLQYVLAPLVVGLAIFHFATSSGHPGRRGISCVAGAVAVVALGLALYRGYYWSLGW